MYNIIVFNPLLLLLFFGSVSSFGAHPLLCGKLCIFRAGGTGPVAPVLAGPIFPTRVKKKVLTNSRNVETWRVTILQASGQGGKIPRHRGHIILG